MTMLERRRRDMSTLTTMRMAIVILMATITGMTMPTVMRMATGMTIRTSTIMATLAANMTMITVRLRLTSPRRRWFLAAVFACSAWTAPRKWQR
ncbi:hypothetical protein [Mesorhizobium sp. KR1-2]|uniref:hypothetical protein n=1 Tax=Mesorhizobium sp. KR1-2 TaxID=3156609 RepID=UPI0032B490D9